MSLVGLRCVALRWAVRECSVRAIRRGEDGVGIPKLCGGCG